MTPKEKAKELVDKYCYAIRTEENGSGYYTNVIYAKNCALIAVDEIIESMDSVMLPNPFKQYWNKVKQEIQAL